MKPFVVRVGVGIAIGIEIVVVVSEAVVIVVIEGFLHHEENEGFYHIGHVGNVGMINAEWGFKAKQGSRTPGMLRIGYCAAEPL